ANVAAKLYSFFDTIFTRAGPLADSRNGTWLQDALGRVHLRFKAQLPPDLG
ncbi:hypothetical protein J6590_033579, partial [Homalodisca vitripennis]